MKIKITKDFVIGVLVGAVGVLWSTSKSFADAIKIERLHNENLEPVDSVFSDEDMDTLFGPDK